MNQTEKEQNNKGKVDVLEWSDEDDFAPSFPIKRCKLLTNKERFKKPKLSRLKKDQKEKKENKGKVEIFKLSDEDDFGPSVPIKRCKLLLTNKNKLESQEKCGNNDEGEENQGNKILSPEIKKLIKPN